MVASVSCDEDRDIQIVYFDYILSILFIIAAISLIPSMYIYIKAYMKGEMKSTRILFYGGLTFFATIMLNFTLLAVQYQNRCHNEDLYVLFYVPTVYLYISQGLILLIILFIRLIAIFKPTTFAVSKLTISIFVAIVMIINVTGIPGSALYFFASGEAAEIGYIIWSLAAVFYILGIVWLNALFIHKLKGAYNLCKDTKSKTGTDKKLVELITKTTLLCFVSTVQIIIFLTLWFLLDVINSPHFVFIVRLIEIADLYTNYLSILLSYNYFDPWYIRICGFCHQKCYSVWNISFQLDDSTNGQEKVKMKKMASTSKNHEDHEDERTQTEI